MRRAKHINYCSLIAAAWLLTRLKGKPATLAATAAKESTAPKKSTDVAPKLGEAEAPATEATVPDATRTGSASSDSSNEEKRKKKASKSKSRSASRGKRASIFGGFLGKKDKPEEKKEEKKAEEAEEKKAEEIVPPVTPLAECMSGSFHEIRIQLIRE